MPSIEQSLDHYHSTVVPSEMHLSLQVLIPATSSFTPMQCMYLHCHLSNSLLHYINAVHSLALAKQRSAGGDPPHMFGPKAERGCESVSYTHLTLPTN